MLVLIKGAGDLATGVAVRLHRAGFMVVMTDLPHSTAVRRTVSFCEAIPEGEAMVEGVRARRAADGAEALGVVSGGDIAVIPDPEARCREVLKPAAVVDAILAKRNTGTALQDARAVVALGPGFTAGVDCHAVVETMRGHDLGRVLLEGSARPNTGVPGEIGGYTVERLLRAPSAGVFHPLARIGDVVKAGDVVALVFGAAEDNAVVSRSGAAGGDPSVERSGADARACGAADGNPAVTRSDVAVRSNCAVDGGPSAARNGADAGAYGAADGNPVVAQIGGVVRGLLREGTPVHAGMKSGDIDPRCEVRHCFSVSDKARAIGGGVLEAILFLGGLIRGG